MKKLTSYGHKSKSNPLTKVTIAPPLRLPATPPAGVAYVGYAYDFGPAGATLNPAIEISIEFDPAEFGGKTPVIYKYEAGKWIRLDTTVVGNKAIVKAAHLFTLVLFAEEIPTTLTPVVLPTPTPQP